LLLVSLPENMELPGVEDQAQRAPLIVELGPPQAATIPSAPAVPPATSAKPESRPPLARQAPPRRPSPTPAPLQGQNQVPDLSAMIEAARERRRAEGRTVEPAENPPGNEAQSGHPGDRIVLENIQRSLQQGRGRPGTNGLFQILSKGPRMASFSFRGWSTDSRKNWNQIIEVDAGPNGDVERAIVRKMIELIRQHHKEDFNWESRRLGRVVQLSARPRDSAGLEDFLMSEFFSGAG
jgi:hypothetical protein